MTLQLKGNILRSVFCIHEKKKKRSLTETSLAISMQVVAHATFAAVPQSSVVTPVTQNTDLLTSPCVYTTRVWNWKEKSKRINFLQLARSHDTPIVIVDAAEEDTCVSLRSSPLGCFN